MASDEEAEWKLAESKSTRVNGMLLLNHLNNFCCQQKWSDVTLVSSDGKKLPGHKVILAKCKFFATLFNGDQKVNKTIRLGKEFRSELLTEVVRFIYSGHCELTWQRAVDLYELAATQMVDKPLKLYCQSYLATHIDNNSALRIYLLAQKFDLLSLSDRATNFLNSNMQICIESGIPQEKAKVDEKKKLFHNPFK